MHINSLHAFFTFVGKIYKKCNSYWGWQYRACMAPAQLVTSVSSQLNVTFSIGLIDSKLGKFNSIKTFWTDSVYSFAHRLWKWKKFADFMQTYPAMHQLLSYKVSQKVFGCVTHINCTSDVTDRMYIVLVTSQIGCTLLVTSQIGCTLY